MATESSQDHESMLRTDETATSTPGISSTAEIATSAPEISDAETVALSAEVASVTKNVDLTPGFARTVEVGAIPDKVETAASASGSSSNRAAVFSSALPMPRPMESPPGFPPNLVGRALQAAEFFHAFEPGLICGNTAPGQAGKAKLVSVPTARTFLAALAGSDLGSFEYIYGYIAQLLHCIRSNADWDEHVSNHPIRKANIMELVRLALEPHFGQHPDRDRLTETDLAVESLRTVDYDKLSVWQKLALIEGLSYRLLRLPAVRRWLPMARLKPLASLTDGSRLWWLRCAPDRLLIEPPPAANPGDAGTWRYYATREELKALRHATLTESSDMAKLDAAIKRVLQHRQLEEPDASASSVPTEAAATVDKTDRSEVGEYLRSWFISRLIGAAEVLNKDLPPGSCMSQHRLRHYLTGSVKSSELADCLLQFEEHLAPAMRNLSVFVNLWRENLKACGTLSALNWILERTLAHNGKLCRQLDVRRGVCGCCHDSIESDQCVAFCRACCVNYHRQCAELADAAAVAASNSAAPVASARSLRTRHGLWLCTECRRPPKEPPVKKHKLTANYPPQKPQASQWNSKAPPRKLSQQLQLTPQPNAVETEKAKTMEVEQDFLADPADSQASTSSQTTGGQEDGQAEMQQNVEQQQVDTEPPLPPTPPPSPLPVSLPNPDASTSSAESVTDESQLPEAQPPSPLPQHALAPENLFLPGCINLRAQVFGPGPLMVDGEVLLSTPKPVLEPEQSREMKNILSSLTPLLHESQQHLSAALDSDSAQLLVPAGSSSDAQSNDSNACAGDEADFIYDVEMTDSWVEMNRASDALVGTGNNSEHQPAAEDSDQNMSDLAD